MASLKNKQALKEATESTNKVLRPLAIKKQFAGQFFGVLKITQRKIAMNMFNLREKYKWKVLLLSLFSLLNRLNNFLCQFFCYRRTVGFFHEYKFSPFACVASFVPLF